MLKASPKQVNIVERDVGANKDTIASVDAEKLREEWGLNDPLILQWWRWVSGIIFRADFGTSYTSIAGATPQGVPVVEPIQNLRSPTPCLMGSPNIEVSSRKSPTLLSIERVNGSGGDALSQNSG